jgi:IclR family transcriptional regulator, carbohydrate utilization repressor
MTKRSESCPATPTVQVIERMFNLLEVLASREEPVSLKEISEKTGLHPSTAHRILNDLTIGRFVDRPEAGQLPPGHAPAGAGQPGQGPPERARRRAGPMRELHKQIQQPVNLSVRQGDEIVYVERAYSERSGMQVVRAIGGRAPLHLTSVGKLFLAADDPQRCARLRHPHRPGRQHPQQPHPAATLERELRNAASRAWRATTKSWSWACAAWPPASTTTRANWSPACRSRRPPTGSTKTGCPNCRPPPRDQRGAGLPQTRRRLSRPGFFRP